MKYFSKQPGKMVDEPKIIDVNQSRYRGKIPQKPEDEYRSIRVPILPNIVTGKDKGIEIKIAVKKLIDSS